MTQERHPAVTFVTKSLVPERGMERALVRLAGRLADRYAVRIVVLEGPSQDTAPGVRVVSLESPRPVAGLRVLRRQLLEESQEPVLVLVGLWISVRVLLAAPSVLGRAVAWEHSLTLARIRSGPRFRLKAELAALAYRRCARVVAVSEAVADALHRQWGIEAVVVPNLLELPARSDGDRRRPTALDPDSTEKEAGDGSAAREAGPARLIAVGAAKPVKNYALLLRALVHVRTPWTLQVLGGGPMQDELQELATSLQLDGRVEWLGDVPDVRPYLAASDLLVHPARSETFGYVLLEAAEQWLPVVAVDAPVMDRLVPGCVPGVLCEADAGSLAAAVEEALARPGGWNFLAADRLRRELFSDDRTVRTWIDLVDRRRAARQT